MSQAEEGGGHFQVVAKKSVSGATTVTLCSWAVPANTTGRSIGTSRPDHLQGISHQREFQRSLGARAMWTGMQGPLELHRGGDTACTVQPNVDTSSVIVQFIGVALHQFQIYARIEIDYITYTGGS